MNPLDIEMAKIQMNISKKVVSIMAEQEQYFSKDPTKHIGLITIDCSIKKKQQYSMVITIYKMSAESTCFFHGESGRFGRLSFRHCFLGYMQGAYYVI